MIVFCAECGEAFEVDDEIDPDDLDGILCGACDPDDDALLDDDLLDAWVYDDDDDDDEDWDEL